MTQSPNSDSSSLRPVPRRLRRLFERFPELRAAWDDPLVDHYLSTQSHTDALKSYLGRLGLVVAGFVGCVYVLVWIIRDQYVWWVPGMGIVFVLLSVAHRRNWLDFPGHTPGLLGLLKSKNNREIEEWLLFPFDAERAAGLVALEPFLHAKPRFLPSFYLLVLVAVVVATLLVLLPMQAVGLGALVLLVIAIPAAWPLRGFFYRYEMAMALYSAQESLTALHSRRTSKSSTQSWSNKAEQLHGWELVVFLAGPFYLLAVCCLLYARMHATWWAALGTVIGLGGMWGASRYQAARLSVSATSFYIQHRERFITMWEELWPRL